ncbi:MAG: hypothetical protein E7181_04800 [Erysipelotrichaceae bacterium]|nr:hypothetical protein [Erysipelotrichaceae bacterium]
MSYKEELKKQIKALKEFEELRKADPSKALKFDNLLKIRQIGAQTWKFFLSLNNSPKLFGGKDAYDAFIARNHDLLKGNRIETITPGRYGEIKIPDIDFDELLEVIDKEVPDKEGLEKLFEKCDPQIRSNKHPLENIVNDIKKDVDEYYQGEEAEQLKASLDYANNEMIQKTGQNLVDDVIDAISNIRMVEAHEKFTDFVIENNMDPNKVVNGSKSKGTISPSFAAHPENIEYFKPIFEMEPSYSEDYKNKLFELDEELRKEGLLQGNNALGESGSKEYGLADYFSANYKLKNALVKYSTLTSEEEKKAKLQEINQLTNNVKEVSAKYDIIFDFIEKNFDLDEVSLPGNLYSGRPGDAGDGDLANWKPDLPPKYDFEKSKAVVFLSGFMQLKGSAKAAGVSLEDYVEHPTKSFLIGAKKITQADTDRIYLPRSEENTLGKRMAHALYFSSRSYAELSRYNMSGGRGMEFLANTSPDNNTAVKNTIISMVIKDYNRLYYLTPEEMFSTNNKPDIHRLKYLFVEGDNVDKLYEVSPNYGKEDATLGGVVKDYSASVRKHANTPVDEEYKRITKAIRDFCTERKYMAYHEEQFLKGAGDDFICYNAGGVIAAGRQYFVDYLKENNLSTASVNDPKLREEINNFLVDPIQTIDKKVYKFQNDDVESLNEVKRGYSRAWYIAHEKDNGEFFTKFNEFNHKPNGYNVGKTFPKIIKDNRGGWYEWIRGTTSKEYTALQKVAKGVCDMNSPIFGDKDALYACAKAYKAYKMPEGTDFNRLSKTAKKRVEFCDSVIKAYEAEKREKEAEKNPELAVNNNNIINQDEFQKNLQADLAPKKLNIINEETAEAKAKEKDPPEDEGVEP